MTAEARAGPVSLLRSAAGEPQLEPIRRPKPAQAAPATSHRRPRPARGQWHGACSLLAWGLLSSPCLRQPRGWPGARMLPRRTSVGGSAVPRAEDGRQTSGQRVPEEPRCSGASPIPVAHRGRQSPPLPAAAAAGSGGVVPARQGRSGLPAPGVGVSRDAALLEPGRQKQAPRNAPAVLTRSDRLKS